MDVIEETDDFAGFSRRYAAVVDAGLRSYVGGTLEEDGFRKGAGDPVLFVHLANVDRHYALWQEVHGYSRGRMAPEHPEFDDALTFAAGGTPEAGALFGGPVTPRTVFDIAAMPGAGNSYRYGADQLALFFDMESAKLQPWRWFTPAASLDAEPEWCTVERPFW
eukprot:TRINITY_DN11_c0_g1_i1.p3 TRINITY_DN11_c0_g1~~TRINITY_DN11_c0_g1_i1.p3  ORF type:complete len:164 (+),score=51.82 TRINITY_DN11_c0_g1_i1:1172-1663(+)